MTATRSAAEIAATLTKAQRRALVWFQPDEIDAPVSASHARHVRWFECELLMQRVRAPSWLWEEGKRFGWRLTPLGAEVRAILASTEPSNADG